MSFKGKYLALTAFCTAAAVCASLAAYGIFRQTPKITVEDKTFEYDFAEEAEKPSADEKTGETAQERSAFETAEAISQNDRINENTTIVYEYYYEENGKTEKAQQKAPRALLNLTREQLVAKIEGFSVESFSSAEVVLRKRIGGQKANKYVLGVWDGYVAVFYRGSGISQSGLKEVTDTPVVSLSEYEQKRLKEGIAIEGDGELMKVLEDYGS